MSIGVLAMPGSGGGNYRVLHTNKTAVRLIDELLKLPLWHSSFRIDRAMLTAGASLRCKVSTPSTVKVPSNYSVLHTEYTVGSQGRDGHPTVGSRGLILMVAMNSPRRALRYNGAWQASVGS